MATLSIIKDIKIKKDQPLIDIINKEKTGLKTPCNGKGKCLKCLCSVEGDVSKPSKREIKLLGEDNIKLGIRLGCEVIIQGDAQIKKVKK